jgi:hypothetical protein
VPFWNFHCNGGSRAFQRFYLKRAPALFAQPLADIFNTDARLSVVGRFVAVKSHAIVRYNDKVHFPGFVCGNCYRASALTLADAVPDRVFNDGLQGENRKE